LNKAFNKFIGAKEVLDHTFQIVENRFPQNRRLLELLEEYYTLLYGKDKDNKGDATTDTTQTAHPDPNADRNIRPTPSTA